MDKKWSVIRSIVRGFDNRSIISKHKWLLEGEGGLSGACKIGE